MLSLLVYLERFGTSIFELSSSDSAKLQDPRKQEMFLKSRMLKLEIERSATYIGYKLLWVITLFLEGKKFPQGSLTSDMWRYYVYDVVRFCTNEKFMAWFLDFDADSFFTILRKLFNDPEPSEYIRTQETFINKNREKNPFLEPCFTHMQILAIVCLKVEQQLEIYAGEGKDDKAEGLKNAHLFFMTSVCKNPKIDAQRDQCYKVIMDQIMFHKKLMRLPKRELQELIPDTVTARKEKDRTCNIYSYLVRKNEKDVIQVLNRIQAFLEEHEVQTLLDEA